MTIFHLDAARVGRQRNWGADACLERDFRVKDYRLIPCFNEFDMNQEAHEKWEWARAKLIRQCKGITAPQLGRYAADGLIRSSHIRRPGQTRGVRLYHVGDLEKLINASIKDHSIQDSQADSPGTVEVPGGPLPTPAVRIKRKAHRRKIHHDLPTTHDLPSRPADGKTKP